MSDVLDAYQLRSEDMPFKLSVHKKRVGRVKKMTKTTSTTEAPKASRKYNKTRGEHYKDIVIAMLITGVIAFAAGIAFANKQAAQVKAAVSAAQSAAVPAAAPAPADATASK